LILIRPHQGLPPGVFADTNIRLQRQWRQVQGLADSFWKRYRNEYLPLLQKRQLWLTPRRDFQTGDLVIMVDNNAPRSQWRMARVSETYPSDDGRIRKVKVRTADGHFFERPIQKLCLLEAAE